MAKLRVAYEYTEAEDKSIRLGLFLIISGVVSLFIFGFCWLSPALQDLQATAANCTVLSVQQIGEVFECTFTCGADCRGTSQYPCVQVYVNNSESNSRALLHSDEHQLLTNPKCSYIPPCKRENQKNLESVMNWQQYWKDEIGSQPFTCYFNQFQSSYRLCGYFTPEDTLSQPLFLGKTLSPIQSMRSHSICFRPQLISPGGARLARWTWVHVARN
ncbi:calcium-activated potassium channel subunit beta-4 isoform X1 [Ailuropoda melanoleuca]|uniref:Calcium-activated potassium channel subunit beta n=1 Tax=Ailuropoda melanoleuca TaxID=9646 RepID=G1LZT2_AILME|nr:calcium-activated potassium channel subunit beta-4 isoform X1 [Ailuropoda melanoleuca]